MDSSLRHKDKAFKNVFKGTVLVNALMVRNYEMSLLTPAILLSHYGRKFEELQSMRWNETYFTFAQLPGSCIVCPFRSSREKSLQVFSQFETRYNVNIQHWKVNTPILASLQQSHIMCLPQENEQHRFADRACAIAFAQRLLDARHIVSVVGGTAFDDGMHMYRWADDTVVRDAKRLVTTSSSHIPRRRLIEMLDLQVGRTQTRNCTR